MKTTFEEFCGLFDQEMTGIPAGQNSLITNGTSQKVQDFVNSGGIAKLDLSANIAYSLQRMEEAKLAKARV